MATSLSVLPDKFDHGDFNSWLRNFDVCATANGWSDADKLRKLPAFLRGQASSFYHTLAAADTDTYAHLTSSLRRLLCPKVARERYFSEFDGRSLRPGEDPSLYLYELTELLFKADPDLSDDAKNALLARQFMKGLPADTRLKLLESNPTPSLAQMCDFIHSFYATRPSATSAPSAAFATGTADRPSDALQSSIVQLTAAVTALATQQSTLQTAVEEIRNQPHHQPRFSPQNGRTSAERWKEVDSRRRRQQRCFQCGQPGHFRSSCPWSLPPCPVCFGFGHTAQWCPRRQQQHSQWSASPPLSKEHEQDARNPNHVSHNSLNFNGVPQ